MNPAGVWSVSGPGLRVRFWWDGRAGQDQLLQIVLQVQGWPFPTGALEWLVKAAGATSTRIGEPGQDTGSDTT